MARSKAPWAEGDDPVPESKGKARGKTKSPAFSFVRYGVRIFIGGVVLVGGLYGFYRTERFVIRDPRFMLPTPEYGVESPGLKLAGMRYASRLQILHVFSDDFGRSLYLVPLKRRREQLRAIDWIKDASISRIWPNRLMVQVEERQPVAFLPMASSDHFSRFGLIDADGFVLETPPKSNFKLPVVTGIGTDEAQPIRREKVHRLMYLMTDIGGLSDHVSEVDVSDRDNLKVTAAAEGHAVVLLLGNHNFAQRLQNFISHYPEIVRRLPDAHRLDMRLEDRITVVDR